LSIADSGTVDLLGFNMAVAPYEARARVGVVPQQDALDPDFSVRENLLVFGRYFGLSKAELEDRIPALLAFASLEKRGADRVTDLSGGLKRRLTLARALINDPEMIFLDEPTTALDPQARHLIWERLQSLREQGKTLLLTTHFMDEAQRLCDRILIIDHGRAIASGTPRTLIKEQIDSEVIELFGRSARAWLEANRPEDVTARLECSGDTVFVYTKQARLWLVLLEGGMGDLQYLYRPANLEDVFLRLTGRDLRDD
jgi:lipooligosaccharide transport system ATP-binding protein